MITNTIISHNSGDTMMRSQLERMSRELSRKTRECKSARYILNRIAIAAFIVSILLIIQLFVMMNMNKEYANLEKQYNSLKSTYVNLSAEYAELQYQMESMIYSDDPDSTGVQLVTSTTSIYNSDIPMSRDLQEYAYNKCNEYGIDYNVFLSLIKRESNFNPNAKSKSGDYGLCQINKCNHAWMREVFGNNWDPMNPYHSIDGSTYILNNIINTYNYKSYHTLLMGYNMGPGGAKKCFNKGIYSSKYSRAIMEQAVEYGYTGDGMI